MFNGNRALITMFISYSSFSVIFCLYLIFIIQFIISRLCYRYYCLFRFYEKTIDFYMQYRPDFITRYRINCISQTIFKNKQSFRTTVRPINKINILMLFSFNLFYVYLFVIQIYMKLELIDRTITIFQIISFDSHLIFNQLIIHLCVNKQDNLLKKLLLWREMSLDLKCNHKFKGNIKCTS